MSHGMTSSAAKLHMNQLFSQAQPRLNLNGTEKTPEQLPASRISNNPDKTFVSIISIF